MRFSFLFSLLAALMLVPMVSAKTLRVYILTGQSNSLGAVKGDPLPDELLQVYSTEQGGSPVLMWNGNMSGSVSANEASKNLVVPDEGKQWEPVAPQLPAYGAKCMGPEFGFAYTMRRLSGTNAEDIAVIKCSRDGGGNEQWAKGQSLYGLLLNSVHTALGSLDKKYDAIVLEGVLYLQGESNRTAEGADTRFLSFCEDLRKDIKAKPLKGRKLHVNLKKAVVGECATWGTQNNATVNATAAAMRRMAEADTKHRGFVVTRDLDKITAGDPNLLPTGDFIDVTGTPSALYVILLRFPDGATTDSSSASAVYFCCTTCPSALTVFSVSPRAPTVTSVTPPFGATTE